MSKFLPTTPAELEILAWDNPDIIIISGDAYIDHPSFGTALIGRWLQFLGFRVAVLPQPDWRNDEEFMSLGKPGLFFGITAGNMDSMVNHYTAQRKLRSYDAYSPEGKTGLRPDRAAIVYSQQVKRLFSDVPIILGGLEASLRRIPHYDFWSNKIRNSILFDSRADMIVYGMAEIPLQELTHRLAEGENLGEIQDVNGTVVSTRLQDNDGLELPEFHKDFTPDDFHRMSCIFYSNYTKTILYQKFSQRYLRHNIPARNLTQKEMDLVYDLPFTRQPHPRYTGKRITAFEQIKNSLTSHRGCFGGCSFCTLTLHQGRKISSRSIRSLGKEAEKLGKMPYFKGTISDVGGPTANMYGQYCKKEGDEKCLRDSCLFPDICPYLETSHRQQLLMLDELNNIEGVKHIFIASGIRFDLALRDERYIRELAVKYTGGLLKLAPEHYSNKVLQVMKKPDFPIYEKFFRLFTQLSREANRKQYIVPYIMVGHPGTDLQQALELALYLCKNNIQLTQVQEFTPTPLSRSTMIYYTGKDEKGNVHYVPRGREIRLQKALVQWFQPANRKYVREALRLLKKEDLGRFFFRKK